MRSILAASLAGVAFFIGAAVGGEPRGRGGPPPAATPKPPQRVSLVRMISWAEPAPEGCDADLEGTSKPAQFTLRYREVGKKPVTVVTTPDELFAKGWGIITRSARGMGFERAVGLTELDFDIVEELRCSCERKDADAVKENHLVKLKVAWKPGQVPSVTASTERGETWEAVQPVTINGYLASWDFRFVHPLPGGGAGECSSRFDAELVLDQPLE